MLTVNAMVKYEKQLGFTLLETLVALSVLAITLGVLYQIFGTSLRNIQYAKDYSFAQMLAESKLSEIGKGIPVVEGNYGGEIGDKYTWVMNVEPVASLEGKDKDLIFAFKVMFTISWGSNGKDRSIDILTYRLSTGEV